MFKIIILYDDIIGLEDVPEDVGIMCINCVESIDFLLDNQTIEKSITPFVTNMVFQNVGLSWFTKSNQKLNFYFQKIFFLLESSMVHGITL